MAYNVYIVCNYQDDIINGAVRLKEYALDYICSQGTVQFKDLIGVITLSVYYGLLCCVKKSLFVREGVSV